MAVDRDPEMPVSVGFGRRMGWMGGATRGRKNRVLLVSGVEPWDGNGTVRTKEAVKGGESLFRCHGVRRMSGNEGGGAKS